MLQAALNAAARGGTFSRSAPAPSDPPGPTTTSSTATGTDPRCRDGHTGWEPRATTDPGRIPRGGPASRTTSASRAARPASSSSTSTRPSPATPRRRGWDLPGIRDGADVLAVLCRRAGEPYPAGTYTVSTPSGGTHLYFAAPPGGPELRNTQGAAGGLGWLVDTRAGGGYVVGGGSTVDGRPYTVTRDTRPGPAARAGWPSGYGPPRCPRSGPSTCYCPPGGPVATCGPRSTSELARVLRSHRRAGHNAALYRAAVALGQLVAGGALSEADVTAWLTDAAEHVGQRPGETARTIASGMRAGARRPRSVAA